MIVTNLREAREQEMITKFFDRFGKLPMPKCYKCQAPVEKFEVKASPDNDTITFKVYCHDEREESTFYYNKVMSLDPEQTKPVITYAFYKHGTLHEGKRIITL